MSREVIVEFSGFEAGTHARVYNFTVREPSSEPRDFALTISNSAFTDRLIRYQDGPDICSRKLRHELAAHRNNPPESRLDITVADLEDYRSTHTPSKAPSFFPRKPSEDY